MCSELTLSPVFNLSMASKELFHSNMLYWISQSYPDLFLSVLTFLGIDTKSWGTEWTAFREKDHFDLSICKKHTDQYLLILENKVKSIPTKHQLDEYTSKIKSTDNPQLLLLSLCTEFSQKEDIEQASWKIVSYADLLLAIRNVMMRINDPYHHALLDDYCLFIGHLHRIQKNWSFKPNDSYLDTIVNTKPEIAKLEDVRKKVLISRMADSLLKSFPQAIFANNKEIENKKDDVTPGQIYIYTGMSRTTAILDIKIRITGNLLFVLQLQGDHFKHCIEVLGKNDINGINVVKSIKNYLKDNKGITLDQKMEEIIIGSQYISKGNRQGCQYGFEEREVTIPKAKEYNQYGESFVYQYVKINKEVTIGRILDVIQKNIEKITTLLK